MRFARNPILMLTLAFGSTFLDAPEVKSTSPSRIRVECKVQEAKVVLQVRPTYPAAAKNEGIEGTLQLRTVIATTENRRCSVSQWPAYFSR
jgi:hypothetical protein